jgi:hypothetical protein
MKINTVMKRTNCGWNMAVIVIAVICCIYVLTHTAWWANLLAY